MSSYETLSRGSVFSIIVLMSILGIISATKQECRESVKEISKKHGPPGMNPELFPEPEFAMDAPECIPEREPCGWYSFSLHEQSPFRWQKSWCRCSDSHVCVYDTTDMKMKVYKQICRSKQKLCNDEYNGSKEEKYFSF